MSELPDGWVLEKLGRNVSYKKGKKPNTLYEENVANKLVPYLDIQALEKGVFRNFADPSSVNLLDEQSIAMVWDGARSGWISKGIKGGLGSTVAALTPNNFEVDFLFYFLKSKFEYLNSNTRGTGIPHVDPQILWDLEIPLAPLPEQKRIVAKLDTLFAHLDQLKARLEKIPGLLKQFRQAVLTQAVTGKLTEEWREINKVLYSFRLINFDTVILSGPQNGMYKSQSFYGSGNYILRIDNFYDGKINRWESLKRLQVDKDELHLYGLANDDIIINRVNSMTFLGKSAIVKQLPEPCVFESNMMRIKLNTEKVDPEYIILFLNSQNGLTELRKNAKQAVNQASINQQDVKAVQIYLPETVEEQKEIVRRVESLFAVADRIEASYKTLQEKIDQLPQAILSKAFRGELVAGYQDLADETLAVATETAQAFGRLDKK